MPDGAPEWKGVDEAWIERIVQIEWELAASCHAGRLDVGDLEEALRRKYPDASVDAYRRLAFRLMTVYR